MKTKKSQDLQSASQRDPGELMVEVLVQKPTSLRPIKSQCFSLAPKAGIRLMPQLKWSDRNSLPFLCCFIFLRPAAEAHRIREGRAQRGWPYGSDFFVGTGVLPLLQLFFREQSCKC